MTPSSRRTEINTPALPNSEDPVTRPRIFGGWADRLEVLLPLLTYAIVTLTGFQVTGPVPEKWKLIDPEGQYETEWNRGASYIRISFQEGWPSPKISNPNGDIIEITADPCELTQRIKLSFILSSVPQSGACLKPAGQFIWGNQMIHGYRVGSSD